MSFDNLVALFEKYAEKVDVEDESDILKLFEKYAQNNSNVYPNNPSDLQKLFEKFAKTPNPAPLHQDGAEQPKGVKRRGRPCKKNVDDPRAFGICPKKELVGQKRKGKDGKFWTVVKYGKKTERYKWVPVRKLTQNKRASRQKTPKPVRKNQWVRFVTNFHRERQVNDPEYTLKRAYTDARPAYQEYKSTLKSLRGGNSAPQPSKSGGSVYLDILRDIRQEHPNLLEKEKRKLAKEQYHELKN